MVEKYICEYPLCKKETTNRLTLEITNEQDAEVDLPFCEYHFLILVGGQFKAKVHGKQGETTFEIIGPLELVDLIQQIMGAREHMASKLKSSS